MITPQQCRAKLADKTVFNSKFIHFSFELIDPPQKEFVAGQYISLQVTDTGVRRSYSICSSPETTHGFELLADISPNGLGSNFLQNLQFGQEVNVLMPMGMFTVADNSTETSLALVGTGSGIAPFRSMIFDQLQNKHDQRSITLYWGMREVNQMFWVEEFQSLANDFSNFHYHPVISKPIAEWPLCVGHVTDCLATHAFDATAGYYLCGNAAMMQDCLGLFAKNNVPADHIHHEKFH